jgi:hypothetical protein
MKLGVQNIALSPLSHPTKFSAQWLIVRDLFMSMSVFFVRQGVQVDGMMTQINNYKHN